MRRKTLVEATDVYKTFSLKRGFREAVELAGHVKPKFVKAVDGISVEIWRSEIMGLVGESGCGKTTLGKLLVQLEKPDIGRIAFREKDITRLNRSQLKNFRKARPQRLGQEPRSPE